MINRFLATMLFANGPMRDFSTGGDNASPIVLILPTGLTELKAEISVVI